MENTNQTLEKLLKTLFAKYPAVEQFFVTSDGQAFTQGHFAEAHAKELTRAGKDGKIDTRSREGNVTPTDGESAEQGTSGASNARQYGKSAAEIDAEKEAAEKAAAEEAAKEAEEKAAAEEATAKEAAEKPAAEAAAAKEAKPAPTKTGKSTKSKTKK